MQIYSPHQFALFRFIFGVYLLFHFFGLYNYAPELFSSHGTVGEPSLNPTYSIFPNLLVVFDSPSFTKIFIAILIVLSLALSCGIYRRAVAVLLWYGWACLLNRNLLISNPGIPFVGWLLLVLALIPSKEPFSISFPKNNAEWSMPGILFWGAWIIMALSYTISGIHKLASPSWVDGSSIYHLLYNPLARTSWIRDFLLGLPSGFHALMTWSALALEILFAPLCFFKFGRMIAWTSMIGMHLGILTFVNFSDLTFGMLTIHLFTFDRRWLRLKNDNHPILFFDGVCGLCNKTIDFLLIENVDRTLKFASLQGKTASERLDKESLEAMNTMILVDKKGIYRRSEAVLRTLCYLGGIWLIFGKLAMLAPSSMRNSIYDLIARNRFRIFGKKETCRIPTAEDREMLLP